MKTVRMTLFVKMLILLLLSTSVPLSVLGYFAYKRSNEQLEAVAYRFLMDHLQQNSVRLSYFLNAVNQYSESILASQKLQSLLAHQDAEDFNEISFMHAMSSLLLDFNTPYDVRIYPIQIERFPNYVRQYADHTVNGEADWFVKARLLEGKGFWYRAERGAGPEPGLFYIRLIRSVPDLQHLGIVMIGVSDSMIANELILSDMYNRFQVTLLSAEQHVLFNIRAGAKQPPDAIAPIDSPNYTSPFQKVKNRDGMPVYMASQTVGPEPWRLVETIPAADLTGPLNQIKDFTLHIFLIAVPLITLFLVLITRHFTVPLKWLAALMKRAQLGELKASERFVNRPDEVGNLARGYNEMIASLKHLLASTKKIEREKNSYEMQLLMNQINPHFLYNTLESIKWQANSGQTGQIGEMVQSLVNVLRFSINDGKGFTTLEREIGHIKSYLNIELMRNSHAFEVFYQIPAPILNAGCLKLIIQPVVENAVRHGMYKLKPGKGKIIIQVYAVGQDVWCSVSDNGPGCDAQALNRRLSANDLPVTDRGGIGLYNVHRRLRLEFGETYGIQIDSSALGTSVLIRFPLLRSD